MFENYEQLIYKYKMCVDMLEKLLKGKIITKKEYDIILSKVSDKLIG